jgi:hypothetical protein
MTKKRKTRHAPNPDKIRRMLRHHHGILSEIGGNWKQVPNKLRWKALVAAHEIASELRHIGNGVDDPMKPKGSPTT